MHESDAGDPLSFNNNAPFSNQSKLLGTGQRNAVSVCATIQISRTFNSSHNVSVVTTCPQWMVGGGRRGECFVEGPILIPAGPVAIGRRFQKKGNSGNFLNARIALVEARRQYRCETVSPKFVEWTSSELRALSNRAGLRSG